MATGRSDTAERLSRSVYVSNIRKSPRKDDFKKVFTRFGSVTDIVHIQPPDKLRFAFVTFTTDESAKKVLKEAKSKNGVYYAGSKLWIAPKRDKKREMDGPYREMEGPYREMDGPALINILDDDCMLYIFSYLTFEEKLTCQKVCARWREISFKCWGAAKSLRFYPSLEVQDCVTVLRHATNALKTLDLSYSFSSHAVEHLLNLVPTSVTEFTFEREWILEPDIIKTVTCAVPNLKVVHVFGVGTLCEDKLAVLLVKYPQLEELNVEGLMLSGNIIGQLTSLRRLHLIRCNMDAELCCIRNILAGIGENLEEFSLNNSLGSLILELPCPKLKKFSFKVSDNSDKERVYVDFSAAPNLEELTISRINYFITQTSNVHNLVTSCPALRKLTLLSTTRGWHESQVEQPLFWELLSQLPNLTYLDLRCTKLCGVNKALPKLKKLETLFLHEPGMVSRQDLISLINGLPQLQLLDMRRVIISKGESVSARGSDSVKTPRDIEMLCNACISDGDRPTLELVIADSIIVNPERRRWRCGRYVIYHPILKPPEDIEGDSRPEEPDSDSDGFFDSDDEREWFGPGHDGYGG